MNKISLKTISAWVKEKLTKGFNVKSILLPCIISFISFSLIFPSGAFANETIHEVCADYYADISKNRTVDNGQKKLSGLLVQPEKNGAEMRKDTDKAITELWGVFKGNDASFAPVKNANKEHDIYFRDNDYSGESLSLVCAYNGQSAQAYHTKKDTDGKVTIIDYKFQSSPIALMFPSVLSGITKEYHIYISQAQAERKLREEGVTDITYDALLSLQYRTTTMTINGASYNCVIDNIYLDNFSHSYKHSNYDYYYATDVGTVIGDFVFIILTHIAKEIVFPKDVKDQALYVMSEYSFRNKFYLEYAMESYPPSDYSYDYARYNLKSDFTADISILKKALNGSSNNVWCIFITIFSILFYVISLFFIVKNKLFIQPLSVIIIFIASIIPFAFFRLLFALTINTYFFSNYSLLFNFILLITFILFILFVNLFGHKLIERKER